MGYPITNSLRKSINVFRWWHSFTRLQSQISSEYVFFPMKCHKMTFRMLSEPFKILNEVVEMQLHFFLRFYHFRD